jgi:hypothetical protein
MIGFLVLAGEAEASTVYTYSFEQDGYQLGQVSAVLTGSFSATVESDGYIEKAGLTDVSHRFKTDVPYYVGIFPVDITGNASDLKSFSYLSGDAGSTLLIWARHPFTNVTDYAHCVGAADGSAPPGIAGRLKKRKRSRSRNG